MRAHLLVCNPAAAAVHTHPALPTRHHCTSPAGLVPGGVSGQPVEDSPPGSGSSNGGVGQGSGTGGGKGSVEPWIPIVVATVGSVVVVLAASGALYRHLQRRRISEQMQEVLNGTYTVHADARGGALEEGGRVGSLRPSRWLKVSQQSLEHRA